LGYFSTNENNFGRVAVASEVLLKLSQPAEPEPSQIRMITLSQRVAVVHCLLVFAFEFQSGAFSLKARVRGVDCFISIGKIQRHASFAENISAKDAALRTSKPQEQNIKNKLRTKPALPATETRRMISGSEQERQKQIPSR
jgi:hypothetical protein